MISTANSFIFLHIPKTGGNSIQKALLPFSDDHIVLGPLRDGVDRFEIQGPITSSKHMTLEGYATVLGERLKEFCTVVTARDPLDRAVSMYFSPHRVLRRQADPNTFDLDNFSSMLAEMPDTLSYLYVNQRISMPNVVLRFSHLQEDFAQFARERGIPSVPLTRVNLSAACSTLKSEVRSDPRVAHLVRTRFASDYEFLSKYLAPEELVTAQYDSYWPPSSGVIAPHEVVRGDFS